MREKSREERFDEVFQIVLIIVALSFDVVWTSGRIPIAEIAVFIFVLTIWAFGNLKGGIVEYPYKLGSFNLSIMLLTSFYLTSIFGEDVLVDVGIRLFAAILLPILCLIISLILASYLKETIDKDITRGILIGGTIGYVLSSNTFIILSLGLPTG